MNKWIRYFAFSVPALIIAFSKSMAGNLDPTDPPSSTMHTLEDIYQKVDALTQPGQTLSDATTSVAAGFYMATNLAQVDVDLVAENIKEGINIFGIIGTYDCGGTEPEEMVLVPAGSFMMGNATNVFPVDEGLGSIYELPQHSVYVSAFYMAKYEVTKALWDDVANWAIVNGYDITASDGEGVATNHPVNNVTWYECVKWCNARSQKESLTPCYTNADGSIFKSGTDVSGCNWSANGYRLPTEAEWEKASRGGVAETRFPWTDFTNRISHLKANYRANTFASYDLSYPDGFHPLYDDGTQPYTSPVGSFSPNGYGLYDMAGNIWEWCWDWYANTYYEVSPGSNPRGPDSGVQKVQRGGAWQQDAIGARCACRNAHPNPSDATFAYGFRCVRAN